MHFVVYETYFLPNDPQEKFPLTSVACLHCKLSSSPRLNNNVTSLAGTCDRRYTSNTHDPIGLREKIEGVAIGHQVDGEVPRRS